ncbi:energy-coupling factor transporter ATPase [Megamonas funiformis]|nr:energy-coupling factor transporter ATPase [Megamonas funiformis]
MPIEVKNISHIYMENTPYEKKALNNVSLTINEGEFVAIAGHTGSGKSTLMQHFNGLLNPTKGEVFIDGIDINKKKDKKTLNARRSVGMVFQYPEQQLFEESIFADIAFGPRNFGCSEDEVKQRVKDAMDFVELDYEEYKDKSPFLLSGGQMRRVAIAGIIALKPKYLVLDEPTAGLDPRLKQNLLQKVKKLHQKEKMTIIMVSHNMDDIALLADKVAIMRQGKLMIYGEPREVFAHKDVIEQAGLLEPEVMQLLRKIKEYGLDVDINALNKQEALNNILVALRKRGIKC